MMKFPLKNPSQQKRKAIAMNNSLKISSILREKAVAAIKAMGDREVTHISHTPFHVSKTKKKTGNENFVFIGEVEFGEKTFFIYQEVA